jgi:two-component system NarL family sensor kinase
LTSDPNSDPRRALVAERILAEQEERRRLAELIHDGPVQHVAAITQIVDAALDAVREGDRQQAVELLTRGLQLTREAGQDLRALCEDLEPRALRELGFASALEAYGRRVSSRREVEIVLDVHHGDELGEHAQTGLFQIVRDAVDQAVRRGALTRIEVSLVGLDGGGAELSVADDGPPERRSAVLELLADRASTLNGRFTSEARWPRGSTIRIELPPSSARR